MSIMDAGIRDSFIQHGEEFRTLFRQLENHNQVHAYLITGEKGTGKKTLARMMGASLLCASKDQRPCCVCRNCLLAEKEEHPDLTVIGLGKPLTAGSKKERSTIPVEDIREMIRQCGTRSTDGNFRVVLIYDADKMTLQAQNSLLKTLEEPPSDVCMILVTDHPESILSTVVSRCRQIRLKAWEDAYVYSVLKRNGTDDKRITDTVSEANGSIGEALRLASEETYWDLRKDVMRAFFYTSARSDILSISNRWKDRKQDSDQIFSILESFVRKLSEARFIPEKQIDLSDFPSQWQAFSHYAEKERFVALAETVKSARMEIKFSTNFQAVIEKTLFIFIGEGNKWLQ